jgi:4-amino-4-deoxy-L-arabinose transferase-like glycosyltransferase
MPPPSVRDSVPDAAVRVNAAGWRLFTTVILVALTVPRLWQRGMFLDGITYAVVSRNMALGVGSFWAPSFSTTAYAQFFEQPPLGLALQAVVFAVFGDHFAVERAFSLIAFATTAILTAALWRRFLPERYNWLPLIFWVLPSVATWAVINNMLEVTQAVFTTFAVFAVVKTCGPATRGASFRWSTLGGLAVVAACLVKGPVGLFPLAVPLLFPILKREHRPRHPWITIGALVSTAALTFMLLLIHDGARHALTLFASTHLVPTLEGDRGVGSRSADIARHLTFGVWARMGALAAVVWLLRRRSTTPTMDRRPAGLFLAIGGAASLPILISPVIAGHYLFPSLPFFALGFAAITLPAASSFRPSPGGMAWRFPAFGAAALAAALIGVLGIHGPLEPRNRDMIRSLDRIAESAPREMTVGACPNSRDDWSLMAYLQRFYRISIVPEGRPVSGWFIMRPGGCQAPTACDAIVHAEALVLYRCTAIAP